MTTTAAPGTGLDWVTFTNEDRSETCAYRTEPCSRQATHVGFFVLVSGGCELYSDEILYCLAHRDLLLRQAVKHDGYFCCAHGALCTVAQLIRMEPLR